MSNTLKFTTTLDQDSYVVTVELTPESTLPKEIFAFENQGTDEFNNFTGIVDVAQLTQYPKWTGTPVPVFSVPFIRLNQGVKRFESLDDIPQWRDILVIDTKKLVQEMDTFEPIVVQITI